MTCRTFTKKILALLLLTAVLFSSCKKDELETRETDSFDAAAVIRWNEMYLEIERYAAGYRPGPAPRSLAYLGLSAYEACVPGMVGHQSVAELLPGLSIPPIETGKEYHWPTVAHASYSYLMPRFFPAPEAGAAARMVEMEKSMEEQYRAEAGTTVFERSMAYGEAVAEAVWNWSASDAAGHNTYADPFGNYDWEAHYDSPGDWQPTFPGPGRPMFPFWGQVRTFAILPQDKLCRPPIPFSENPQSAFFVQALEVYYATDDTNWENGQWIAKFWSDDLPGLTFSPGPRWLSIATQAIKSNGADLETALFCYAKLGLALNDAAVACWHSKYVYNLERPVTYINRLIDPDWKPTLRNPLTGDEGISPSFPAYPSGHSTMGGAGAEVLTDVFGNRFERQDLSHQGRTEFNGTPRYFDNFYQMAEENALSRIPLGVHFRMDCEVGVELGYLCGRRVNRLPWLK